MNGFWDITSLIADIVGIVGAVFALLAWVNTRKLRSVQREEQKRLDEEVQIALQYGAKSHQLPGVMRRKELTRAEVLGRLGMLPLRDEAAKKFELSFFNSKGFWEQMRQILDGQGKGLLTIPCTAKEFEQFDL